MTTSRLLLALALLVALAACEIGGSEIHTGASAACVAVNAACTQSSDCCSYGCLAGVCVANPAEGGACRTTNDCAAGRLCKSGGCTTPTAGMCRDEADVCSAWSQCCSGNCEVGACTQNRPPVANVGPTDVADVPYTKIYTLQNQSTDPDGDPLSYGWSFVSIPAGSAALLSSTTAASPTFTPDKEGPYVARLVITDGPTGAPNRYTVETQVTIHAVNRLPQPTATASGATCATAGAGLSCSRNNPVRISATVTDVDGDSLECAWRVTEPSASAPTLLADFAACANPSSAVRDYSPAGEGTYVVEYVVRDHDRTTGTVVHTVAAAATFLSRNDPPVPAVSRSPYYGNLGASAGTTPAVTLDATSSTDPNGDHLGLPGLSYFWEMVSASDGGAVPAIALFDTATPSFVPPRVTDYVLRLTVSDPAQFNRAAASASMQVTVSVGRYVQPLAHGVVDVARAATADKLVLAGRDPADGTSTKGMLWVYDLATGTEGAGIPLVDGGGASGVPKRVDVTPDGARALVFDEGVSIWIVTFGVTPTMTRVTRPFPLADVVVAGNRYAYLLGAANSLDTVRELDLQTGTISTPLGWPGYGFFGTAYHGSSTSVYRVDEYSWYRSTVNNSGAQSGWAATDSRPDCGGYPLTYANRVWATQNATFANAYVISSCGRVYRADTLASLGTTLGVYPSHVDSTGAGAILVSEGTTLSRFNAALQAGGTDLLPRWSQNGYGYTTYAAKAFFDAAGAKRVAVVHDTAPVIRYGIVTFP